MPIAVVENANGYFSVNYAMLGLRMVTLDEWEAQGMAALLPGVEPTPCHAMLS